MSAIIIKVPAKKKISECSGILRIGKAAHEAVLSLSRKCGVPASELAAALILQGIPMIQFEEVEADE